MKHTEEKCGECLSNDQSSFSSGDWQYIDTLIDNQIESERQRILEIIDGMEKREVFAVVGSTNETMFRTEGYNQALKDLREKI